MSHHTTDKKGIVLEFLKEAFLVDGEVKFVSHEDLKIDAAVKFTDSKRGEFYIGLLKKEQS